MPSLWLWAGADVAQLREAFAKDGMPGYLRKRIEQLEADGVPAYGPVGAKPDQTVQIAGAYARLDEKEAAFDCLERAYRCTPAHSCTSGKT